MKLKISKKLIVSSLASVMAVSLVGAVTGTVAWYQYNTRVSASLIGMNVAETGVLEISPDNIDWSKDDLLSSDLGVVDTSLTPITCGVTQTGTSALSYTTGVLNAWKNPNHGKNRDATNPGSYAEVYQPAVATDYIQFTVYLRARTVDNVSGGFTQKAEEVRLHNLTLANVGSGTLLEGLRVHLACYDDGTNLSRNFLLSNTAKAGLKLYGELDLDGDGIADRLGGYEWQQNRDQHVVYGTNETTQTTTAAADLADDTTVILNTPASGAAKIVVTVWLEGWENDATIGNADITKYLFSTATVTAGDDVTASTYYEQTETGTYFLTKDVKFQDGKTYYTRGSSTVEDTPMWSGLNTDGAKFKLGMTFSVADDAFVD